MKLPEHMTIELACYVRSDSAENGGKITVGGCVDTDTFTEILIQGFTKAACDTLNEALRVTDARPMTKDEVKAHQEGEREDLRAAGHIAESERVDGTV
jgi:hypothetical protein